MMSMGRCRERLFEHDADRGDVRVEGKIRRDALAEPRPRVETCGGLRDARDSCIAERQLRWIGNQRGDDGGRRHEASRR